MMEASAESTEKRPEDSGDGHNKNHAISGFQKTRNVLNSLKTGDLAAIAALTISPLCVVLYTSLNANISAQKSSIDANGQLITDTRSSISEFEKRFSSLDSSLNKIEKKIDQGNQFNFSEITEVKAKYQSHSAELDVIEREMDVRNAEMAEQIRQAYTREIAGLKTLTDEIVDTVGRISASLDNTEKLASLARQNNENIVRLDDQYQSTAQEVGKLELVMELGIADANVRQAVVRLAKSNPDKLNDASSLEALWQFKAELTDAELFKYITDNYTVNPTDSYIISYDALSLKRPLNYFLQKKDLRSIQVDNEPELGALTPESNQDNASPSLNLVSLYELLEEMDLTQTQMSVIDVCNVLPQTPLSECYRDFLQLIGNVEGEEADKARSVDHAVQRALIQKYGQ